MTMSKFPSSIAITQGVLIPETTVQPGALVVPGVAVPADVSQDTVTPQGATTPLSLAGLFSPLKGPKSFGAIGDGVADDTAAAQAFVTGAAPGGVWTAGSYFLRQTIYSQAGQTMVWLPGAKYTQSSVEGVQDESVFGTMFGVTGLVSDTGGVSPFVMSIQGASRGGSASSSEVGNLYLNYTHYSNSSAAVNKDGVVLQVSGQFGAGVTMGRLWGMDILLTVPPGTDGFVPLLEAAITNHGSAQADIDQMTSKLLFHAVAAGSAHLTAVAVIDADYSQAARWFAGYVFKQLAFVPGAHVWALRSSTGVSAADDLAYLDASGNLFCQTARTAGLTVATLPPGQQGARTYVTDALNPAYLAPVVGGGSVVCPVFHNGATWIVGG